MTNRETKAPFCLIPARGGSKRLVNKNLALLGGKPLLAWTIEAARASEIFETIWVSSDDPKTLEVAEGYGAVALPRPADLAGDSSTVVQVCSHFLQHSAEFDQDRDAIYVLLPTSPFRKPETIREAWKAFSESGADSLLSVVLAEHPPQWSLKSSKELLAPMFPEKYELPRSDLDPAYFHDGGHAIAKTSLLLEKGVLMSSHTIPFPVSREEAVDINEPLDLDWANFLLTTGRI